MDIIKTHLKIALAILMAAMFFAANGVKAQAIRPAGTSNSTVEAQSAAASTPAGASAAPVSQAAVAQAVSSTYILAPYDIIEITVYQEEDLHKVVKLGGDGTVILPLIGTVELGGKTVAQGIALLRDRYAAGYVRNPDVLISVLSFRPKTFRVLGQVGRQGIYPIEEGQHVNILDAILMAGGVSRIADDKHVLVKRLVKGKETVIKINVASMAKDPDVVPFEILPDDIIYVQESMF